MGELSREEMELLPTDPKRAEMVATFLYTSLSLARTARETMERSNPMSDAYLFAKIEFDGAIKNARENLEKLRAVGYELDTIIAAMVEWEGL